MRLNISEKTEWTMDDPKHTGHYLIKDDETESIMIAIMFKMHGKWMFDDGGNCHCTLGTMDGSDTLGISRSVEYIELPEYEHVK